MGEALRLADNVTDATTGANLKALLSLHFANLPIEQQMFQIVISKSGVIPAERQQGTPTNIADFPNAQARIEAVQIDPNSDAIALVQKS